MSESPEFLPVQVTFSYQEIRIQRVLSSPLPGAVGFGPRLARGSTRRRALSVSLPSKHKAGGGVGRAAAAMGKRRRSGLGTAGAPTLRPGLADARAAVSSAPRGVLGRARLRGGDCGGRVNSAQGR